MRGVVSPLMMLFGFVSSSINSSNGPRKPHPVDQLLSNIQSQDGALWQEFEKHAFTKKGSEEIQDWIQKMHLQDLNNLIKNLFDEHVIEKWSVNFHAHQVICAMPSIFHPRKLE